MGAGVIRVKKIRMNTWKEYFLNNNDRMALKITEAIK